ncbi:MAG: HesA/MoeB/ThiF family protein [Flavobacteriaceae bacterium]|nr:MAG: HesA/MoeB/ThiF family protein [Flavobacteriaceae bacterium]
MERARYDRQIRLRGFGEAGQKSLQQARVLVVGAGGLGVPVCLYLNSMGVGTLGIVDADVVETSNLHRQPAYREADVGKRKIDVLADHMKAQNPHTRVVLHPVFLQPSNALDLLEDYDLVVDATDRIPTRYLLDDACVIRGIPWIYGALHGFEGQLSVFNYQDGPTYRCLFPKIPKPGEIPDCNQLGTLGVLPGIMGTRQALEAVKILCGLGEVLSGRLLLFSALDQESRQMRFPKDPAQAPREIRDDSHYNASVCETGGAISVEDYLERNRSGKPHLLVDVREETEFDDFHLPDSLNIPLMELQARIEELVGAPEVYLICKSGSRSAQAYRTLQGQLRGTSLKWILGGVQDLQAQPS